MLKESFDKVKVFKKLIRKKNIDVAVFYKNDKIEDKSIRYLLGLNFNPAVLFVFARKKPVLYVTPLDKLGVSEMKKLEGVDVRVIDGKKSIYSCLRKGKDKVIGVHESILPKKFYFIVRKNIKKELGYFPKLVDCDFVAEMREVKFSDELKFIQKAISITELIFKKVFFNFSKKKFKYETDVVKFLKIETIKFGCELAFEPVVASGKNSANPHYYSEEGVKLKKGFCVIDFGVKFKGYSADITRTIFLGKPNQRELGEYDLVLKGLDDAKKKIFVGGVVGDVFEKFQEDNFKMIHALGHGIGLDIHEAPGIGAGKANFKCGNVVAVEPGVYYKGKFGIRIEDDFILLKNGLKCLCQIDRCLRIFEI